MRERKRVNTVIFNGVCAAHNFNVFKTFYRAVDLNLYLFGQRRRHSLQIHFFGVHTARFNKKLVALFVGKTDNFVLNAWTVAGTDTVNIARIKRRAVKVIKNYLFGFVVGVCNVTTNAVFTRITCLITERHDYIVAFLHFHF